MIKQTKSAISMLISAYKGILKASLIAALATISVANAATNFTGAGVSDNQIINVANGDTALLEQDVTISNNGKLEFAGSQASESDQNLDRLDDSNFSLNNHNITIEKGGKLVFSLKNKLEGGSNLNISSYLKNITNHGQIVIGQDYNSYEANLADKTLTAVSTHYSNVKAGADTFKNGGAIIINPHAELSLYNSDNEYIDLATINIATATKDEIDAKASVADLIFVRFDKPNKFFDEDSFATIETYGYGLVVGNYTGDKKGTFDLQGLHASSAKNLEVVFDEEGNFNLKNGFISAPTIKALNGNFTSKNTIKLTGESILGLDGKIHTIDGNQLVKTDLNGLNFELSSDAKYTANGNSFPLATLYLDNGSWDNLGNVTIKGGLISISDDDNENLTVTSKGTLTINPSNGNKALALISGNTTNTAFASLNIANSRTSNDFTNLVNQSDSSDGSTDPLTQISSGLYVFDGATLKITGTKATNDVNYSENGIYLNNGTIAFEKDALDLDSNNALGAGFNTINIQDQGSVIEINTDGLTNAQKKAIKDKLTAGNYSGVTFYWNGSEDNTGGSDINTDDNGRLDYASLADVSAEDSSQEMRNHAYYVEKSQETNVIHTIGAVHANDSDTLNFSGTNAKLVNAATNNGFFASYNENGNQTAANLNIKVNSRLELIDGGKANNAILGSESSLSIEGAGDAVLNDIKKDSSATNTSLDVSGSLNAQNIDVDNMKLSGFTTVKNATVNNLNVTAGHLKASNLTVNSNANFTGGFTDISNLALDNNTVNTKGSSDKFTFVSTKTIDNGNTINGTINVGLASAFGLGCDNLDELQKAIEEHSGVLQRNDSAIFYVKDKVNVQGQVNIGLDIPEQVALDNKASNGINVGNKGIIAVDANAAKDTAITIANGGNLTSQGDSVNVVITGDVSVNETYKIFDQGTQLESGKNVQVSSANGVFETTVTQDDITKNSDIKLAINKDKADAKFAHMSNIAKNLMLKAVNAFKPGKNINDGINFANFVATSSSGMAFDGALRMAAFAATPLTTVEINSTSTHAIKDHLQGNNLNSIASQNNGFSIWFTPSYKYVDGSGFDSQGTQSDADIDITSATLGADYTFDNNVTLGAMFNIGTGSTDGNTSDITTNNDFDFYTLGLYAGYTFNNFSLTGDVTYSQVDNEVEQNNSMTKFNKLKADFDSDIISAGIEGAYAFNLKPMQIKPHVGLRYSAISIDDYNVKSDNNTLVTTTTDTMNVFSIPVGVEFSSDIKAGDWTISPSLDLVVTANIGDTDVDYNSSLINQSAGNMGLALCSEVMDNISYGAKAYLGATYGDFNLGLGLSYMGSSLTNSIDVVGRAQYNF